MSVYIYIYLYPYRNPNLLKVKNNIRRFVSLNIYVHLISLQNMYQCDNCIFREDININIYVFFSLINLTLPITITTPAAVRSAAY